VSGVDVAAIVGVKVTVAVVVRVGSFLGASVAATDGTIWVWAIGVCDEALEGWQLTIKRMEAKKET
jgi:hypothetical protein